MRLKRSSRRRLAIQSLEKRQVMAAYINEVMFDPLGGLTSTGQYVELRGTPNEKVEDGTYLVVVSDDNRGGTDPGKITGIFDLSGQQWGSNGFMVLLPQNSPYSMGAGLVDGEPAPTVLRSTAPGFGGLPGNIYTNNLPGSSNELSFIGSSVSFLLIQSDVAPKLGDDIDTDNNGTIDAVADKWDIQDSVSLHDSIFTGSVAYGRIAFIQRYIGSEPVILTPPGTNVVYTEGFGYVARIGDSIGYKSSDWVGGSVVGPNFGSNSPYFRFSNGTFASPEPYSFTRRQLDHLGESNFFGGVRGKVTETIVDPTLGDHVAPVSGVRLLADTNNNGKRDIIQYAYDPDDFAENAELSDVFPGVTLTTVNSSGNLVGSYEVEAATHTATGIGNKVFSPSIFDFVPDSSRIRADFASPVRSVSIDAIANYNFTASVGYIEAFNAAGESLGYATSRPLQGPGIQQTLKLTFSDNLIAYAVFYTAPNSPGFASFDDLKFSQSEAIATTDDNGEFEFNRLLPDEYNIVPLTTSETPLATPIPTTPFTVTRYENLWLDFSTQVNSPPEITPATFSIAEDAAVDTPIGTVQATDVNTDQTISFSIEDEASSPVRIDAVTGELFVKSPDLLDFEKSPTVTINVIATDSVGSSSQKALFLKLTDVNEPPVIEESQFQVSEEAAGGEAIGRVDAYDPEDPSVDPLFEIIGGTGKDQFNIDPSTGVITVKTEGVIDFETSNSLTLEVAVSDHSTPSLTRNTTVSVSVVDANDPPQIATEKLEVLETSAVGASLGFVEVTDQDTSQKFLFRITEGGSNTFKLDEKTGELTLIAPLNFETRSSFDLQVQVVDNGAPPRATLKTVKVQVIDVNEPATLKVNAFEIAENSAADTNIGTLEAVDPEKATGLTFKSMNDSNPELLFDGKVKLNAASGKLTVNANATLDAEATAELTDRVFIYQGDEIAGEVTVTLKLKDVNEGPAIATSSVQFPKNFPAGRGFASIDAQDPEQDDLSYEVTGLAANRFYFTTDNLLALKSGSTLDFDTNPEYKVTIKVTDSEGNNSTKDITVTEGQLPRVGTEVPDQTIPVGTNYLYQLPYRFRNPNVRSITMIGSGPNGELPKGLRFDSNTGRIIGTALPAAAGSSRVKVQIVEPDGDDDFTKEEEFELTIERSDKPLLNPNSPFDVDANGRVNALDALRIINFMAKHGNGGDANELADVAEGFFDCSGNNVVTAQDALLIINYLRRTANSSAGSSSSSDTSSTSNQPTATSDTVRLAAPDTKTSPVDQAIVELSQGSLF